MEPPQSSKQIGAGRQGGAIELIYRETNVEERLRVSVVRDLSHPAIVLAGDVRNKAAGRVDAREPDGRDGDEQYGLSKRESEVLLLLVRGRTRRAISESLSVSEETIKSHITNIYLKIGVHSREELITLMERRVQDLSP